MAHKFILTSIFLFLMLPGFAGESDEAKGMLDWKVLEQVKMIEKNNLYVPEFTSEVQSLAGTEIVLQGYMMPLEQAKQQKNFVLSANPVSSCFFCTPGGPESMVEVRASESVAFSYNLVTLTGKLELLEDDPMGMFYRLTDAKVTETGK